MRRRLSAARLALPWWLFRLTGPGDALVLDWRYRNGWGRADTAWIPLPPVRSWSDRSEAVPQHMCRDLTECPCFDQIRSGDVMIRSTYGQA